MHGRLKIKTTAEQAAEKQKEREEKKKFYLGGMTKAFSKRSSGTHDEEGLKITSQLLMANPDAATLWNFRREILLNMKGGDEEWTELLNGELSMVEGCLMKNPKSYGAWHHRCWTMAKFPSPPWDIELELCNRYLKLDERNFHCWDYRRFVTTGCQQQPEEELKVSKQLIERNLSNYSAWHYRSKLLPTVFPPSSNTPHPIPVDILVKELKMVVDAMFTDPSDQSPWFFLRWLINRQQKNQRLMQIGYKCDSSDSHLICVFAQPISLEEILTVSVNGSEIPDLDWFAPSGETFSNVWAAKLDILSTDANTITILRSSEEKTVTIPAGSLHFTEWVTDLDVSGEDLSDLTRSTLEGVKENCVMLDELEPDNKWVLLTLVDLLWALNVRSYQENIKNYLDQLGTLDPLRANYYADMKSKLIMEAYFDELRVTAPNGNSIELREKCLTRIAFPHLLSCFTTIDLSHNQITSLKPLKNLVACKELILTNNSVSDLSSLSGLSLQKLNLVNNRISYVEQLSCLGSLVSLELLDLSGNPVCDIENADEKIRKLLPSVQSLRLT